MWKGAIMVIRIFWKQIILENLIPKLYMETRVEYVELIMHQTEMNRVEVRAFRSIGGVNANEEKE